MSPYPDAKQPAADARPPGARRHHDLLELQRRLTQAQRSAALGALVARLAHELGTPLHSIAGHLDLILGDPACPDALRDRAGIVAGEVNRLSQLIRGYLHQLRAPDPVYLPTDLNELVRATARLLEPAMADGRVALSLDLASEAAAQFPCDRGQVEQVLLNLAQNALDAMGDGGRLIIRTTRTEAGRSISVCDSGHGVPGDVLDRVFDPFFSTKALGRGSGLGLGICRDIARNHGGDILLDSEPDVGTVVTLTLRAPAEGSMGP
jgi:signal transduction histidine kinase